MKIIGFSQLHNELSKGNLHNWMKCMQSVCDYIYIYDNASDDGSIEYYFAFDNVRVVASPINRHAVEGSDRFGKKILLDKCLNEHPDTDWIFWMDGDTVLDNRLLNKHTLDTVLSKSEDKGIEGVLLGHYNLWRSDIYYRLDSDFNSLNGAGVLALWKNNRNLSFHDEGGLHQQQHPDGINRVDWIPWATELRDSSKLSEAVVPSLIHRGFATDDQIVNKYLFYKKMGQTGWDLERLILEDELEVDVLPQVVIPAWLEVKDNKNPHEKQRIDQNELL